MTNPNYVEVIASVSTEKVEDLALSEDHKFRFSMPSGTGDLFKYSTGRPFMGTR